MPKNVHTEHCSYSYCKYMDYDCPVYLGLQKPSFPGKLDSPASEKDLLRRRNVVNMKNSYDEEENS